MKKKGMVQNLQPIVVALVAVAIVLAVGFLIMAEVRDQVETIEGIECNGSSGGYGCNGTIATTEAMEDIPGWLPIIIITVIGALLLGLVSYFKAR